MMALQAAASWMTWTLRSSIRLMTASRRKTEAPLRRPGRRGGIPERPRFATVPLRWQPNASQFWICAIGGDLSADDLKIRMCGIVFSIGCDTLPPLLEEPLRMSDFSG